MYYSLPVAKRTRGKEEERLQEAYRKLKNQKQGGSYKAESSGKKSSKNVESGDLRPSVVLDDSDSEEDAVFLGEVEETNEEEYVDIADNDDVGLDDSPVGEDIGLSFRGVKMEDGVEESEGTKVEWSSACTGGSGLGVRITEDELDAGDEVLTVSEDDEETEISSTDQEEFSSYSPGQEESEYEDEDGNYCFRGSSYEEFRSSSSEEESAEEVEEVKEWNEKEILGRKMNKSSKTVDKGKGSSKKEEWRSDEEFRSSSSEEESAEEVEEVKEWNEKEILGRKMNKSSKTVDKGKGSSKKEEWRTRKENGDGRAVLLKKRKRNNRKENEGKSSSNKEIDDDKIKFGTANHPICLEEIESDTSGEDEEIVVLLDKRKKKNKKENKGKSSSGKEIDDVNGRRSKLGAANHEDEDEEMVVLLDERKKKNKKENKGKSSSRKDIDDFNGRRSKLGAANHEDEDEEMVVLLDERKKKNKKENKGKSSSGKDIDDFNGRRSKLGAANHEDEDEDEEMVVLLDEGKEENKKENKGKSSSENDIDDVNGRSELGAANHPLCFDEVELKASGGCGGGFDEVELNASGGGGGGIDDDEEKKKKKKKKDEEDDQSKEEKEEEHVEEVEKQNVFSKKMKGSRAFKEDEVIQILANSMWHHTELNFEEESVPVTVQTTLPRKFTFGEEERSPPKKTAKEIEMDGLWEDLAMYLSDGVVRDDADTAEIELEKGNDTSAARCSKGCHDLVLDDEMGLVCKFCPHVELESKYCAPHFDSNPCGRSSKRDSNPGDQSILGQLHQQEDSVNHSRIGRNAGTVWDIIPGIGEGMHDHQREGFEFLWKNIAGGTDLKKLNDTSSFNAGNGCIISHAPGTGKTRLAIAFILSYMKLYPECRPVIVAPCGMLNAWEDEFRKWSYFEVPFHNLNKFELAGNEDKDAIALLERCKSNTHSSDSTRLVKFYSWRKDRSILAISYQLFIEFAGERSDAENQKKKRRFTAEGGEHVKKALLELPGLLVFDEGHIPRNDISKLWKTFEKIKTGKRIILSGTPFQNNFDELFNTLSLAYPKFLDSVSFSQHGALPKRGSKKSEAKQLWDSLTSKMDETGDDNEKAQKLAAIRKVIGPFVHVHKGDILQKKLPGLRDSVITLLPPSLQKTVIEAVHAQRRQMNNLKFEHRTSVVSVHPSLLPKCFPVEGTSIDFSMLERMRLDPDAGCKTKFVMELIKLSMVRNEKVLVFSQYKDSLKLVSDQLRSHPFEWIPEKDFLYMDGTLCAERRKSSIDNFNVDSESKVMLASTKACCEGINLVGASRVVLLDVVWNPSVERQAISRAYRLGQKKIVHVYHLISSGSKEEEIYWRQAEKDKLSEIVFHSPSEDQCGSRSSIPDQVSSDIGSNDKILEEIVRRLGSSWFKEIIYQPKELILSSLLV